MAFYRAQSNLLQRLGKQMSLLVKNRWIEQTYWRFRSPLQKLRWQMRLSSKKPWILARHACLGRDVLDRLSLPCSIVNIQKQRVDVWLEQLQNTRIYARTWKIAPFMSREDIIPLVLQQEARLWLRHKSTPLALFMDSFAELTDQKFVHKKRGWSFLAHFSDLQANAAFKNEFEIKGVLEVKDMQPALDRFFQWAQERWGPIPILYIHFPVKLDGRQKFHERYAALTAALAVLEQKYPNLVSLEIPEDLVDWFIGPSGEKDSFPYHYNSRTYDYVASAIRAHPLLRSLWNSPLQQLPISVEPSKL